jgi:hypothetical protein
MRNTNLVVLALLALALTSCMVHGAIRVTAPMPPHVRVSVTAPTPPTPVVPAPPTVTIRATAPALPSGVITLTTNCTAGAPEVLNGLDDNCNGQVDEGFVQSGAVQITLGWSTAADIDLYVTDPFGNELSYANRDSASGGHLDRDARGACTDGQTTENVYWPAGASPAGTYRVAAHYFSNCQAAGVTRLVLSIMVGGQALGVYQYDIGPNQRVELASFTVQ